MKIVKESINFERGQKPFDAMKIGQEAVIIEKMKDATPHQPDMWINDLIYGDYTSELGIDENERNEWIKVLIRKQKYTKNLTGDEFYELHDKGIDWIPYIQLSDALIKYKQIGEKYYIYFTNWSDFGGYFDTHKHNISQNFINAILTGEDNEDYFDASHYVESFRDITDVYGIEKIISKTTLSQIQEKALVYGAPKIKLINLETTLKEIQTNPKLSKLKRELQFAYAEIQAWADQEEGFKEIVKAIKKWYSLGAEERGEDDMLAVEITLSGLKKLAYCVETGDQKIEWNPPDYGFQGSWTEEAVNDCILSRLEVM
jgi:hypothetical protein